MKRIKKGWTLVELCVTMVALSILIGLAIRAVKPFQALVTPFTYAAIINLSGSNQYIMNECKEGTGTVLGCEDSKLKLPDINSIPTASRVYDPYCYATVANFSTIGSASRCQPSQTSSLKSGSTGTNNPNFQSSNMVAYYFLERPWVKINKSAATDSSPDNVVAAEYKELMIDINGKDLPNALGEDQFPIRVYKTGEVLPSNCYTSDKYAEFNDADRATGLAGKRCSSNDAKYDYLIQSYPFAYSLYRSHVDNPSTPDVRKTTLLETGLTYKEAACKSGVGITIPRQTFCTGVAVLNECRGDQTRADGTTIDSFCAVRISKPSMPGLFTFPSM